MQIIDTNRLILKTFRPDDLDAMTHINQDPKVMEFFPNVLTTEETQEFIDKIIRHQKQYGYSLFAVEQKESHKMIGFVGLLHRTKEEFNTPFMPATEIGWRLDSNYWNQGYATEAAKAVLDYAFAQLNLDEVISFTVPGNIASRRVMEKIGLQYAQEEDFKHPLLAKDHPLSHHVLYRLRRKEMAC